MEYSHHDREQRDSHGDREKLLHSSCSGAKKASDISESI